MKILFVLMMSVSLLQCGIKRTDAGERHHDTYNYYTSVVNQYHGNDTIGAAAATCDASWNTSRIEGCIGAAYEDETDNKAISFMVSGKTSEQGLLLKGQLTHGIDEVTDRTSNVIAGSVKWRF